jgi:hypothetical protein
VADQICGTIELTRTLVQFDHGLRQVQLELVPGRQPLPPARMPDPPPEPPSPPAAAGGPPAAPSPPAAADTSRAAPPAAPSPPAAADTSRAAPPAAPSPPAAADTLPAEHPGAPSPRAGPLAEVLERARQERRATPRAPEASAEGGGAAPPRDRGPDRYRDELDHQIAALAELREWLESVVRPLRDLILTVGPFDRLEAVRRFERALADVPGVAEVHLRGYEGIDRAIVDVRLERENT